MDGVTRPGAFEPWLAAVLVAALGAGALIVMTGAFLREPAVAAAGAALAGAALVALVAAGWVDGLTVVALAIPLPALVETESLRVAAAAPITAAVLVAWALQAGVDPQPSRAPRTLVRAAALLFACFALATLLAQRPVDSVRELLNIGVLLALLIVATDRLAGAAARVERLVALLAALAGIVGALAVLETIGVLPGEFPRWNTRWFRAALGFGQPNALGLFLAVVLPLAVYRFTSARTPGARALAALALGGVVLGLVATFSRGAWLSILAGAGVLLFARGGGYALRVWAGAVLLAILADVASGGAVTDTILRTADDWVIDQRAALMLAGVLMFLDHPVLGVGPGGFAGLLERYGAQIPQLWDYLPTPHNAYVQMAAETGMVGLAVFLFFLGSVLFPAVRSVRASAIAAEPDAQRHGLRRALLWSLATIVFAGMVVWPFSHGTGQAVVLVIAAVAALERA
jgi:O-antigen ligase